MWNKFTIKVSSMKNTYINNFNRPTENSKKNNENIDWLFDNKELKKRIKNLEILIHKNFYELKVK